MDSKKVAGKKSVINLNTPDNGEKFVVELSNSALTNIKGQQAPNPDLTITLNRSDLNSVMGGTKTFDQLISEGKAKFVGNRQAFDDLRNSLTSFTPDFELMPGTKSKVATTHNLDPLVVRESAELGE